MANHDLYVVQGKTLDNIAGTMRAVLGVDKDAPIRFDEVANSDKTEQINADVEAQADIIAQIKTALEGKAAGGGGTEITAGFTSEKYKKWLEINGYTIVNFTLTSQATADFIINHPLGRMAKSIICFRADLDGSVIDDKICFAISADGSTTDTTLNRLTVYDNIYIPYAMNIRFSKTDYRAILENTVEYIKLRYVSGNNRLVWASGDYYLAVL